MQVSMSNKKLTNNFQDEPQVISAAELHEYKAITSERCKGKNGAENINKHYTNQTDKTGYMNSNSQELSCNKENTSNSSSSIISESDVLEINASNNLFNSVCIEKTPIRQVSSNASIGEYESECSNSLFGHSTSAKQVMKKEAEEDTEGINSLSTYICDVSPIDLQKSHMLSEKVDDSFQPQFASTPECKSGIDFSLSENCDDSDKLNNIKPETIATVKSEFKFPLNAVPRSMFDEFQNDHVVPDLESPFSDDSSDGIVVTVGSCHDYIYGDRESCTQSSEYSPVKCIEPTMDEEIPTFCQPAVRRKKKRSKSRSLLYIDQDCDDIVDDLIGQTTSDDSKSSENIWCVQSDERVKSKKFHDLKDKNEVNFVGETKISSDLANKSRCTSKLKYKKSKEKLTQEKQTELKEGERPKRRTSAAKRSSIEKLDKNVKIYRDENIQREQQATRLSKERIPISTKSSQRCKEESDIFDNSENKAEVKCRSSLQNLNHVSVKNLISQYLAESRQDRPHRTKLRIFRQKSKSSIKCDDPDQVSTENVKRSPDRECDCRHRIIAVDGGKGDDEISDAQKINSRKSIEYEDQLLSCDNIRADLDFQGISVKNLRDIFLSPVKPHTCHKHSQSEICSSRNVKKMSKLYSCSVRDKISTTSFSDSELDHKVFENNELKAKSGSIEDLQSKYLEKEIRQASRTLEPCECMKGLVEKLKTYLEKKEPELKCKTHRPQEDITQYVSVKTLKSKYSNLKFQYEETSEDNEWHITSTDTENESDFSEGKHRDTKRKREASELIRRRLECFTNSASPDIRSKQEVKTGIDIKQLVEKLLSSSSEPTRNNSGSQNSPRLIEQQNRISRAHELSSESGQFSCGDTSLIQASPRVSSLIKRYSTVNSNLDLGDSFEYESDSSSSVKRSVSGSLSGVSVRSLKSRFQSLRDDPHDNLKPDDEENEVKGKEVWKSTLLEAENAFEDIFNHICENAERKNTQNKHRNPDVPQREHYIGQPMKDENIERANVFEGLTERGMVKEQKLVVETGVSVKELMSRFNKISS